MEITELAENQIPQAAALWEEVGLTRPWNDPVADARRALGSPSSTVLAIAEGNLLQATVMVGHDGHRGWLYYLAVDPVLQGQQLGRSLVQAASTWLQERGVPKVQLMVREENAGAVQFYRHLGYEEQKVVVLGKALDAL